MGKVDEYFFRKKTEKQLAQIIKLLNDITKEIKNMSVELDALEAEVSQTEGVEDSVIVLLTGIEATLADLEAQLAAQGIDTTRVTALKDSLATKREALAAAVAGYTPPTPPVPPAPVP